MTKIECKMSENRKNLVSPTHSPYKRLNQNPEGNRFKFTYYLKMFLYLLYSGTTT